MVNKLFDDLKSNPESNPKDNSGEESGADSNAQKKSHSFYPDFSKQGLKGDKKEKSKDSSNQLRNREKSPVSPKSNNSLQKAEKPGFKYTGDGKKSDTQGSGLNFKKKSKKGKLTAILTASSPFILGIVLFIIIAFLGSGNLLLGSIDENSQEAFDPQYAATLTALKAVVSQSLATGALPSGFAERMTNAGMEVGYLDESNNFIAGLRPSSENSIAFASKTDSAASVDNSLVIKFKDELITAETFAATIETDPEAFAALDTASYGRAVNYYDDTANAFFTSVIKNTRNVFQNYTTTGNNETDTNNFREVFAKVFQNSSSPDNSSTPVQCHSQNSNFSACATRKAVEDEIKATVDAMDVENKDKIKDYLTKIYDGTSDGTAANFAALVNNGINANETYSSIYYYLTLEEAISKTKAGDSANAPINPVLNFFTESATTQVADISNDGKFITKTGAPIQSPTLSAVVTKDFYSSLSEQTKNYSSDRIINAASNINQADANASSTESPISVTTKSSSFIKDFSYNILASSSSSEADLISKFVSIITPSISQSILFNNAGEKLSGIAAGEFFSKGGAALGDHISSFSMGGTTADEAAILSFNTENQNIIAMENAADRASRSPFDISSQNTFLGSIFASLNNSLITSDSALSVFSSLTSSSLTSILPSAFAASGNSYQSIYGNCIALESIGSKGDVFCNPTIVFDLNTISTAIASVEFEEFLADNLTVTKNSNTDPDSINLAASTTISIPATDSYIADMAQGNNARLSNFGVKDSGIYESLEGETSLITKIGNSIKSIASKIASIFNTTQVEFNNSTNINKSTGATYRNSSSNPEWENYRYAQAYFTYSRVLNQMEYFSESNTNKTSLSQYFPASVESPVDSYLASLVEGLDELSDAEYLARISGISVDEADSVLAFVGYSSYLASLDYEDYCLPGEDMCHDAFFSRFAIKNDTNTLSQTVATLKTPIIYNTKEATISA